MATVLVYEYFSGGGCPEGSLPRGLAAEALGMLWAALTDFYNWGAVHTITPLDPRFNECIPGLNRKTLPADEVVCVLPGSQAAIYNSLLNRCDAALIIAPETNGILTRLTAQAEIAGKTILGSSAFATATAGDKAACGMIFMRAKLPTPKTRMAGFASAERIANQMGCPLVAKPVDGIGCEGVFRVNLSLRIARNSGFDARVDRPRSFIAAILCRGNPRKRFFIGFKWTMPASELELPVDGNRIEVSVSGQPGAVRSSGAQRGYGFSQFRSAIDSGLARIRRRGHGVDR